MATYNWPYSLLIIGVAYRRPVKGIVNRATSSVLNILVLCSINLQVSYACGRDIRLNCTCFLHGPSMLVGLGFRV